MLNRMPTYRYNPPEVLSPEFSRAVKYVLGFSLDVIEYTHKQMISLLEHSGRTPESFKEHWYYYNVADIIRLAIIKLGDKYVEFSYKDTLGNIHYRHHRIPSFVWLLVEASRKVRD